MGKIEIKFLQNGKFPQTKNTSTAKTLSLKLPWRYFFVCSAFDNGLGVFPFYFDESLLSISFLYPHDRIEGIYIILSRLQAQNFSRHRIHHGNPRNLIFSHLKKIRGKTGQKPKVITPKALFCSSQASFPPAQGRSVPNPSLFVKIPFLPPSFKSNLPVPVPPHPLPQG